MAKTVAVLDTYLGISSNSQEGAVLRLLIELGAQFVGAEEGSLLVLDERQQELVFAMTVGNISSEKVLNGQRVPLGKGVTGLAAQTHEVQIGAPTFKTGQAKRGKTGRADQPQAVMAAPMLIADRLIGVLTVISFDREKRFTSDDALLYGRVAAIAGVVVDQARRLLLTAALSQGRSLKARSQQERDESEIVAAVTRLTRAKPQAKARIADLLKGLAELVKE
jgi:GAF domain-containing protein